MTEPTTEKLAKVIEAAKPFPMQAKMAAAAREGYYDDFKSDLDFPCVQLVSDLKAQGQHALAQRAMSGEFDATKEESQAWMASSEGQEVFNELINGE